MPRNVIADLLHRADDVPAGKLLSRFGAASVLDEVVVEPTDVCDRATSGRRGATSERAEEGCDLMLSALTQSNE